MNDFNEDLKVNEANEDIKKDRFKGWFTSAEELINSLKEPYEQRDGNVKIIKKGKLPGDKVYQGTCHNCKTQVEFEGKEAKTSCDQREGKTLYSVTCPLCGQTIHAND